MGNKVDVHLPNGEQNRDHQLVLHCDPRLVRIVLVVLGFIMLSTRIIKIPITATFLLGDYQSYVAGGMLQTEKKLSSTSAALVVGPPPMATPTNFSTEMPPYKSKPESMNASSSDTAAAGASQSPQQSININIIDESVESPEDYRLELLHITKTGGTMLEVIALQQNITWGACHFEFPWKHRKRNKMKDCPDSLRDKTTILQNPVNPRDLALWHYPLSVLQKEMNLPFDPYDNLRDDVLRNKPKRFFIVIRNPYSRLLSLHFMHAQCQQTADEVSAWIQTELHEHAHLYGNGFRPCSDYVYTTTSSSSTGENKEQVVHHMLHFENLTAEFAELMEQYHLPLKIPAQKVNARKCTTNVTAHNLTKETLHLINTVYAEDFKLGGYEMIH